MIKQEKLQLNEEEMLVNTLPCFAWTASPDGQITYFNKYWYDYTGLNAEGSLGREWIKAIHPDDLPALEIRNQAFINQVPYDIELRIRNKDGNYRWMLGRVTPVLDKKDKVKIWYGGALDVNDLKETEENLKSTKEKLEVTLKNVPVGICHYDSYGKILYLNELAAYQLGYNSVEDTLLVKNTFQYLKRMNEVFEVLDENGNPIPADMYSASQTLRTGKPAELLAKYTHRGSGESFWLLSKSAPHFDEKGELSIVLTTNTDITSQMNSELSLNESKERFQAAVEAVHGILWTNNAVGEMDGDQPGWSALTGQTYNEYKGYGWAQAIHPDDKEPTIKGWKQAVFERVAFSFKHRVKTVSGNYKLFSIRAIPIINSDGQIREWVGVHTDITEVNEVQKILQESEERFRSLADNAPMWVWIVDANVNIIYANRELLDYVGLKKPDELTNKAWENFTHPDDIKKTYNTIAEAVAKNKPYSMEARTKNILTGEYEWFFLKGVPRFDGDKIVGYIGTGYNIQKLKTQMVELIESETRFRKLADNIQNLAWMANGDGWIFWYNKRWYEYTGTTLEEMQGSGWEKVHHPNNVQSVVDFVSEAWTKNKPWELTFPLRGADGEYKWFLTSAFPITNQNGEIIRWIGTNTDINEQKKAEEQFRILADEAPMWVWMTDSEANIIYANKEQLRFLKLQHFSEFTSDRWKDLVHPDDVSVVLNAFLNASKNHQPYSVEVRFKNPATGIYEWILFKGVPRIDGNTLIGFIGTASNIHQQKTHIEILQSREERFRMLAESLPHLVWMTDANGKQEFTNNRWKEYSGIEPEGEKTWKMMVHPDDESVINAAWANSITNGVFYKSEVRLKNKNGIYRWHYVIGEPIKSADGKIINWIGAFTEIHDQKTVNENLEILVNDRTIELRKVNEILVGKNIELNNTQHFLQTVLDASVDLVAAFDVNLNYTYINKRKQEFIKKSMEEIIGKNILDIYPDLEFTEAYEHMKKALRGEKIREKKRRSLSKENTILEFYFPLFNGIDVIGMVTLSRDITAKNEEE